MKNGVLVHHRNVVRPIFLPSHLEDLQHICAEGLNMGERHLLLKAVEERWAEKYRAYREAEDALWDLFFSAYDHLDEDGEWDGERAEDEEWERRRAVRDKAKRRWRGVAGEWVDLIQGAHCPKGRGVCLVVDVPYPEGLGEDGKWLSREARREWGRMAKGRVREAKEAMKEGRLLPPFALEVPLAHNREVSSRASVEAYVSYTETSALCETLDRLEGWVCEGMAKEKLREAVREELLRR